jgi:hypothetical protein
MKLSNDDLERLALHSAFGVHLIAKWMAGRPDVDPEIRDRLRGHISAIEGVLVSSGHDWIKDEIEATEAALQAEKA